jgi:alpha-galactosidase
MTQPIKEILMNSEVIAIDQDPAGKQGKRVSSDGEQEVWVRDLSGGAHAIALFNKAASAARMTVRWADLRTQGMPKQVRDLWSHSDVNASGDGWTTEVPAHGVALLRVSQ